MSRIIPKDWKEVQKKYYNLEKLILGIKIDESLTKSKQLNKDYRYVDLGLPSGILWAKYNLGATKDYELGSKYTYSEDLVDSVWGDGGMVPTKEAFGELRNYTKIDILVNYNGYECIKFTKYSDRELDIVDENTYIIMPISTTEESLESADYMTEGTHNRATLYYYMYLYPTVYIDEWWDYAELGGLMVRPIKAKSVEE